MTTPEEGQGELDPAHRAAAEVTARTYPMSRQAGEPGSRCGLDQRAVMPPRVAAAGRGFYSADWAMSSGPWARVPLASSSRARASVSQA